MKILKNFTFESYQTEIFKSTKELEELLFEELKLPPIGQKLNQNKKRKQTYSTSAAFLSKLTHLHPLPSTILQYRKLHHLIENYVDLLGKYAKFDKR